MSVIRLQPLHYTTNVLSDKYGYGMGVRFKMGESFRLPLSNRTGCGRDARLFALSSRGLQASLFDASTLPVLAVFLPSCFLRASSWIVAVFRRASAQTRGVAGSANPVRRPQIWDAPVRVVKVQHDWQPMVYYTTVDFYIA